MSMIERRASIAARLEHKWLQRDCSDIVPETVSASACDSAAFRAQFVPGGDWIIVLCKNGVLHLRKTGSDIVCAVDTSFAEVVAEVGANDGLSMSVSVADNGEIFLALTIFGSWDTIRFSTVFSVYTVDTKTQSFHIALPPTQKIHEKYEGPPALAEDLWAFSWWQGSRRLLVIGNASNNPLDRREAVLDVGAFKFQATITLLPLRNQILLSSRAGLMLFNIPLLQPSGAETPKITRARPLWMRSFDSLDEYRHPNVSQPDVAGDPDSDQQVVILGGYQLRVLHLPDMSRRASDCQLSSYGLQTHDAPRVHARNCLSSQRVFFCKEDKLQTCRVPINDDGKICSLPSRTVSVEEARVDGRLRVHDISWDEASGRLCLLVGQHHDYEHARRSPLRIVISSF